MAVTLPAVPPLDTSGDLADELVSFVGHLRAGNVSPNTPATTPGWRPQTP